jgi:hypothetical protein
LIELSRVQLILASRMVIRTPTAKIMAIWSALVAG